MNELRGRDDHSDDLKIDNYALRAENAALRKALKNVVDRIRPHHERDGYGQETWRWRYRSYDPGPVVEAVVTGYWYGAVLPGAGPLIEAAKAALARSTPKKESEECQS